MDKSTDQEVSDKKEIWFRRKWYGWGWFPASWKGWAVTLGYILLVAVGLSFSRVLGRKDLSWLFFGYLIALSIIFIGIAWKKGESPCWQWGRPENKKDDF